MIKKYITVIIVLLPIYMRAAENFILVRQPDGQIDIGQRIVTSADIENYHRTIQMQQRLKNTIGCWDKSSSIAVSSGSTTLALSAFLASVPGVVAGGTTAAVGCIAACWMWRTHGKKPLLLEMCDQCSNR
jgi:hypothetical protein